MEEYSLDSNIDKSILFVIGESIKDVRQWNARFWNHNSAEK